MAYAIVDNNTAVRQLVIDDAGTDGADLVEIDTSKFLPGTTVFSIADRITYMLSNAGTWVDISSEE